MTQRLHVHDRIVRNGKLWRRFPGSYADMMKASILRQIVAGPRLKHAEAGLDLCYVTDDSMSIIPRVYATNFSQSSLPQDHPQITHKRRIEIPRMSS